MLNIIGHGAVSVTLFTPGGVTCFLVSYLYTALDSLGMAVCSPGGVTRLLAKFCQIIGY